MGFAYKDTISPALKKAAAGIADKRPILEAMGLQLTSLTIRAFNEPKLRAAPWANKSDGSVATLRKNQVLVHSIRIVALTSSSVTVGTDRVYAAIHQLGGVIRPKNGGLLVFNVGGRTIFAKKVTIPARPFFPFIGDQMTQLAQDRIRKIAEAKIAALFKA
jgi:phage gpG-like protein